MEVHPNKLKCLKATLVQKIVVKKIHSFTIWAYFPPPWANTKFNSAASMHLLFVELLKVEPWLPLLIKLSKQLQIVLANDPLPTNETKFKKFFTILMDLHATMKLTRITQVWVLSESVQFVVLSSPLTKFIMKDLWSLVQGLGSTFPMDLVFIHLCLGLSM